MQASATRIALHFARAELAEELGDSTQAASEVEAYDAILTDPTQRASRRGMFNFSLLANVDNPSCQIAWIEETAGDPAKADAILASPDAAHFVDCQRFRGDILDHRGDWPGAQQAYAQAVALAPDLPDGYYSWGVALARHGDLAGALTKLQAAHQRGRSGPTLSKPGETCSRSRASGATPSPSTTRR